MCWATAFVTARCSSKPLPPNAAGSGAGEEEQEEGEGEGEGEVEGGHDEHEQ